MDVTLTLNGRDFHNRLSTYEVRHELITGPVVETQDHVEHAPITKYRDVITFSLFPMSDTDAALDYAALASGQFSATYTDPTHYDSESLAGESSADKTATVRVVSDLDTIFGIRSVNGNRYYKQGSITLRAVSAT